TGSRSGRCSSASSGRRWTSGALRGTTTSRRPSSPTARGFDFLSAWATLGASSRRFPSSRIVMTADEKGRTEAISSQAAGAFAPEVRAGLTKPQKELPSKYLYDEVGSALFEVISVLPEYGLARAGERLLRRHADDIVAQLSQPVAVAELGSG